MSVYIESPRDAYVPRNTTVSWRGAYDQTAYELMYKLKSESAWNTLGVVHSDSDSASLADICDRVERNGYSFREIHYRVKVYTTTKEDEETTTGVWYSDAYNLIFRPNERGKLMVRNGIQTVEIPLYDHNILDSDSKLNAKVNGDTVLAAPLVNSDHPLKSGLRVGVSGMTMDAAAGRPEFTETGIRANAYLSVYGSYYGYRMGTGYTTGYHYISYTEGPAFYENYWRYYYISGYYYVYSNALYYASGQYTYSQTGTYGYTVGYKFTQKYYTYYGTGTYYYSGYSAGWAPVFSYGSYLLGRGYYYYNVHGNEAYTYSYNYYYGARNTYRYSFYMGG